MDFKSLLVLLVYFLCFLPLSYWILKRLGVRDKLLERSSIFGFSIAALQVALPLACLFISLRLGALVGSLLGLALSYWYVRKVLQLNWYLNIATVVFLPLAAGILASPIMYIWYVLSA